MSKVSEIQAAIQKLPKEDMATLREWFERFDAEEWDKQFEEDAKSGRLDGLANRALEDLRSGKCREL